MRYFFVYSFLLLIGGPLGAQVSSAFEFDVRANYALSLFNQYDPNSSQNSFRTFNGERLRNGRISGAPGYAYSVRYLRFRPEQSERPSVYFNFDFGRSSYNVQGSLEPRSTTVPGDSVNARYTYRLFNFGAGIERSYRKFSLIYGVQVALHTFDSVWHRVEPSMVLFGPEDRFFGTVFGMNFHTGLRYRPVPDHPKFFLQFRLDTTLWSNDADFTRGFYLIPNLGAGYRIGRY